MEGEGCWERGAGWGGWIDECEGEEKVRLVKLSQIHNCNTFDFNFILIFATFASRYIYFLLFAIGKTH